MSEDFVKVAESKDIGPSTMKAVDVAGEKICIINRKKIIMQLEMSVPIWVDP